MAFQIDGADEASRTGWSVLVRAEAVEVIDSDDLARLGELPLYPWAPGAKTHYVRLPAGVADRAAHRGARRRAIELVRLAGLATWRLRGWGKMSSGTRSMSLSTPAFAQRLEQCLSALEKLLDRPGFGVGPATIGAELELFLVDYAGRPLPRNQAVRAASADPRVTVELDRFNLELNASPVRLAGRPFTALEP